MSNQDFTTTLSVEPEELARLNRVMAFEQSDYINGDDYTKLYDSKEPAVREFLDSIDPEYPILYDEEITFPNGNYAMVEVIAPNDVWDSAYAQAFLYDAEGGDLDYSDTWHQLDIPWELHDEEGNTYTIDVREKERETDKASEEKKSPKTHAAHPAAR